MEEFRNNEFLISSTERGPLIMGKRSKKIRAGEFVEDVRSGLTDGELMEKHAISETTLHRLFEKLKESRLLTQQQLDARRAVLNSLENLEEPALLENASTDTADSRVAGNIAWICPSCKSPRTRAYEVCPDCGIIVAKWLGRSKADEGPTGEDRTRTPAHRTVPVSIPVTPPNVARGALDAGGREESHINRLADNLAAMNLTREIVPIDETNIHALAKDFVFWGVAALGVLPTLFMTFTDKDHQIGALALFFAAIWGVIFKRLVIPDSGGWKAPVASFLFTGVIGIPLLLLLLGFIPPAWNAVMRNPNLIVALLGFIFNGALREELCKVLPVQERRLVSPEPDTPVPEQAQEARP